MVEDKATEKLKKCLQDMVKEMAKAGEEIPVASQANKGRKI